MTATDLGIPGYTDLTEVDRGGFATIYRAWQPTFEREVAIKVLQGRADETTLRRFRRECAAIGALSGHPNIVTVYEAGTTGDGRPFLVMEFLRGGSLGRRLAENGAFDVREVLEFGVRICGAIESAHRAGLLHRDIKPENILLSRLGEPKVADFGLAQVPGLHPTASGGLTATIVHAAPEVLAGQDPSVAADVYSLASTLYCLVNGGPAFAPPGDGNLLGLLHRIAEDPPPDLRSRGVPDELCRVLDQGMAKAPDDRQRGAGQLGRQLQAAQAALGQRVTSMPIEDVEPGPLPADTAPDRRWSPRWLRRRRVRLAAAAVLGLGALLLIAVPLVRGSPPPLDSLYHDNFEGGQSWYEYDDQGGALAYDGGGYRMTAKAPRQLVLSDTSFRGGVYGPPLTDLTDVSVRVRVQAVKAGTVYGVFCRYRAGGDFYQAVMRSDGEALLLRTRSTGLTTLGSARVAPPGTERVISLRLDCTGSGSNRVTMFVDNHKVATAVDPDGPREGSVGMFVSAEVFPTEALFDDFALLGRRKAG
ncbi:MAG: serine/threonine-protein kinase [Acidimicrobiales bacterium]